MRQNRQSGDRLRCLGAFAGCALALVLAGPALAAAPGTARVRHGVRSRALTATQRPRSGRVLPAALVARAASGRLSAAAGGGTRLAEARGGWSRPRVARRLVTRARSTAHATAGPFANVFSGLNEEGLGVSGFSFLPDVTGAAGPAGYVEAAGGQVAEYDRADLSETSSGSLADLAGVPHDDVLAPRIEWDGQADRWLYAALDEGVQGEYVAFGWSKTDDPADLAGGWCHFFIPTGGNDQTFTFESPPVLGHDDGHIVLGSDQFQEEDEGDSLTTALVRAVTKPPAGSEACGAPTVTTFGSAAAPLLTADGDLAADPVPADTSDGSAGDYVLAADGPGADASGDQIMAWHVHDTAGAPTLVADGNLDVAVYHPQIPIDQPGGAQALFVGEGELTQAVAHADPGADGAEAVWTQHTVATSGGRTEVRWYELLPASLTVRQHGAIADRGNSVFGGAISPALDGTSAAIHYDVTGETLLPEIRASSRVGTMPAGEMGDEVVLGVSSGSSCSFGCNWAEYAAATPDPSDASVVWGSNVVEDEATDEGDPSFRSRNFALDTTPRADSTPPETSIDSAPSGQGNGPTATVTFSSDDPDATFECQLDHGGWAPCDSPDVLQGLDDGAKTLDVRATDPSGNTDRTPATASWFVGFPPPNDDFANAQVVTATTGPVTVTGTNVNATKESGEPDHFLGFAQGHSVWYAWTPTASGTAAMSTCGSSFITVLAAYTGSAVDALTEVASSGPGDDSCPVLDSSFSFHAQAGVTYHVAVDGADILDDQVGDISLTITPPAPPTPPDTSITSGPAAGSTTNDATPAFGFSASEAGSTFACRIDAGTFAPCTSPRTLGPLADGPHTFAVEARDANGSVDATPASRTFTVDTRAPSVTITGGPAANAVITSRRPTFRFHAAEPGVALGCRVDDGAFAPCASPHTTARLGDGAHTFAVRATDAAGNAGAPATRSFRVTESTAGRVHAALRRLTSGRARLKGRRRLVLPTLVAGALPKGTKLALALRAHGHALGRRRLTIGRKATHVIVALNADGRRLVRRRHGHALSARLAISVKAVHLKAAKHTRVLHLHP